MPKTALERQIDSSSILRAGGAGGGSGGGGALPYHNTLPGLNEGDPHNLLYLNTARANLLYVPLARTVTAGNGLTGGGALDADRTLALAASAAGAGLAFASGVLSVNPGEGLEIETDAIGLKANVAGAGLAYAAGVLAINPGEGLEIQTDAIGLADTVAGEGLAYAAGVLSVGVANTGPAGLTVEADVVRLTSSSNPGQAAKVLATDAAGQTTLRLLGLGLGKILSDASAFALRNAADSAYQPLEIKRLRNEDGAYSSPAAAHAFTDLAGALAPARAASLLASSNAGHASRVPANGLYALGGARIDGTVTTSLIDSLTGSSLALQPADYLDFNPGGKLIRMLPGTRLQSDNYQSQLVGMAVSALGEGDFRYLYTDELHAKAFIADLEQALAGGQIIAKSVAMIAKPFTAPAAGGTAQLWVKDLPSAANMRVFVVGDIVRLRTFERPEGGGLNITNCWGVVSAYVDGTGDDDGLQRWTFTRSTAPNAGAMAAGTIINPDSLALDYGTSGNGVYEVSAIDGLNGANAPYARIASWTVHPNQDLSTNGQFGKLRGIFGIDNEYGVFGGDGVTDASKYMRVSNLAALLNNIPLKFRWNGEQTVNWDSDGSLWVGRAGDKKWEFDAATAQMKIAGSLLIGNGLGFATAAAMYCAFDGPAGDNTHGNLSGHLGQPGAASGGVIFRPGKFGKAVQVAAATTNYVTNPSFETGIAGWTVANTGTGGNFYQDALRSVICARIVSSSGGNYLIRSNQISLAAGESVTVQCRMYRGSLINGQLQIRDQTAGSTRATASPTLVDAWETLTCTWTNTTGAAATVEMRVSNTHADGVGRFWVDMCQMEKSAYPTPYCDGSMGGYSGAGAPDGTAHAWTGTAHASSSLRAAAALSYPTTGNLNAYTWTIMAWVQVMALTGGDMTVLRAIGTTAGSIMLQLDSLGRPRAWAGTDAITATAAIAPRTWVHLAATYDGTTLRVYANGALVASGAASGFDGMPTNMFVGRSSSAANWINGWIDSLFVDTRQLSDYDIAQIYSSGAPLRVLSSPFELMLAQVTASGGYNEVFGHSGGLFGRTYSPAGAEQTSFALFNDDSSSEWGGIVNPRTGDVIIGDSRSGGGYQMYDASAKTMTIKAIVNIVAGGNAATTTDLSAKLNTADLMDEINDPLQTQINGGRIVTGSIDANRIAANSDLAIGLASAWGSAGAQFQYNGGNPRSYIGNAAGTRYLKYEAGVLAWKAANTELDGSGNLIASNLTVNSALIGNVKTNTNGVFIPTPTAADLAKGYKFADAADVIIGGLTMFHLPAGNISMALWSNANAALSGAGTTNIIKPDINSFFEVGAAARGSAANVATAESSFRATFVSSGNSNKTATVKAAAGNSGTRIDLIADAVYGPSNAAIWMGAGGAGSNYDADKLDGNHASAFATAAALNNYAPLAGATFAGNVQFNGATVINGQYLRLTPMTTAPGYTLLSNGEAMIYLFSVGSNRYELRWRAKNGIGTQYSSESAGNLPIFVVAGS